MPPVMVLLVVLVVEEEMEDAVEQEILPHTLPLKEAPVGLPLQVEVPLTVVAVAEELTQ